MDRNHDPLPPAPPPAAAPGALAAMVDALVGSYQAQPRMHHLDATFLPSRQRTIEILERLRQLIYPGFFDERRLSTDTIGFHIGELLSSLRARLYDQVRQALRYGANLEESGRGDACSACDGKAAELTDAFLHRLPALREVMASDVVAAFEGDPAAVSTDEIIFCYPGVDATFIYRIAHELHTLGVPLLPRIMTEYAHNETGIDIHPGAAIGKSFFIDHGTGVVIGETCTIGQRVKIYQGVTLGALSTKGGQSWRGRKRHPTIGNDVTIYGGAIILGDITIGDGCVIGGSVFLTSPVEPYHTVTMKTQELEIKPRPKRVARNGELDRPSS